MPVYPLTCKNGHQWDETHAMGRDHAPCPTCGQPAEWDPERHTGSFALRGNGWPSKDMRRN